MARLNFILLAILTLCSLALITSQHKSGRLVMEIERERALAQALNAEWKQLQLESSTLAAPALVEKLAVDRLRMHLPGVRRTIVVPSTGAPLAEAPLR